MGPPGGGGGGLDPKPPNSQRSPTLSVHATELLRPPGILPVVALTLLDPLTQVHWPVPALKRHRSFKKMRNPPLPPNSHRSPALSIQDAEALRAPGTLTAAAMPWVPYTPCALIVFEPLTQVHWPVPALYRHRSLRRPSFPSES